MVLGFVSALLLVGFVSAGSISVTSSSFGGGGWIAAAGIKSGDGSKTYVAGGYSSGLCGGTLAAVNGIAWVVQPALPSTSVTLPGGARFEMAAAAANSLTAVIFAGGVNSSKQMVDTIDRVDGSIATKEPHRLSVARAAMTAANVGNYAIFAGGARTVVFNCGAPTTTTFSNPTNAVDMYNTVTGAWTTANLQQPRHSSSSAVSNNRLYIAGMFSFFPLFILSNYTTNMFVAAPVPVSPVHAPAPLPSVNNMMHKYHSYSHISSRSHCLLSSCRRTPST